MNHGIPTASLKELYWNNPDAQRGLESNFKNWQAYYRGQKLKKKGFASKPSSLPKHQNKKKILSKGKEPTQKYQTIYTEEGCKNSD